MKSLFLGNVTVVDHAYIDDYGRMLGGSIRPTFMIWGEVDEQEQVIMDFSKLKKSIKHIIDDNETGLDHKLWILDDSKADVKVMGDRISIDTPSCNLQLPTNAVHRIERAYGMKAICDYIKCFVESKLLDLGLDVKLKVDVAQNFNTVVQGVTYPFRYVHGLKRSSSWGCQSLAHGHYSFLQFEDDGQDTNGTKYNLAHFLHDAVFVVEDSIVSRGTREVVVQHTTADRGFFSAMFTEKDNNIIIVPEESTIENLAAFLAKEFQKNFKMKGIKSFFISEGLDKGSFVQF